MPVVGKSVESTQLAFTAGSPVSVTFHVGTVSSIIRRLVLASDADVYINFDATADNTNFVLSPNCGPISINQIAFTTISAQGVSGAGTLHILAIRD
jgi:hypothetical protein